MGADGGAVLSDTARLGGGETVGSGAGGGAAFLDTARVGGRRLGWEWVAALSFRTRLAWAERQPRWERQGLLEGREGDLSLGTAGEWTANAVKANSFI